MPGMDAPERSGFPAPCWLSPAESHGPPDGVEHDLVSLTGGNQRHKRSLGLGAKPMSHDDLLNRRVLKEHASKYALNQDRERPGDVREFRPMVTNIKELSRSLLGMNSITKLAMFQGPGFTPPLQ